MTSRLQTAICSTVLFCSTVFAFASRAEERSYDLVWEPLFDVGLIAAGVAIEKSADDNPDNRGRRDLPTQEFDNEARRLLHGGQASDVVTASERAAHNFSNFTLIGLFTAPVWAAYESGRWSRFATFVHGFALNDFVTKALKAKVRRQRPYQRFSPELPYKSDAFRSFPSGHSSHAWNAAMSLWWLFPELGAWRYGAVGLALTTGLLRMAADKHFASDVIVGGMIGAGSAYAALQIFEGGADDRVALRLSPDMIELTWRL